MLKEINFLLLMVCLSACASKPSIIDHSLPFESALQPGALHQLWSKKMPGLITDLDTARSGGVILVSTIPDPERPDSDPHSYYARLLDAQKGRELWRYPADAQIKSQTISDDGAFIVLSLHEGQLIALQAKDRSFREVWRTEANCRPMLLNRARKVLCYHDDDVQPGIGFDVFDWEKGAKLFSYPSQTDILAFKIAADEQTIALGATRGQVVLLGSDFKPLWKKKIDGEILDLAVSSGATPKVVVLGSKKTWAFNHEGKRLAEVKLAVPMSQIEISEAGDKAYVYGNGPAGQHLDSLAIPSLKAEWSRTEPRFADFSSSIMTTSDGVIMGLEDSHQNSRHNHMVAFGNDGKMQWNVSFNTEEGAYLYAQTFSPDKRLLGVATDDSILTVYQVSR